MTTEEKWVLLMRWLDDALRYVDETPELQDGRIAPAPRPAAEAPPHIEDLPCHHASSD